MCHKLMFNVILFFDGIHHNIQSQTNRHPSIDRHSRYRQPLPTSIASISVMPSPLPHISSGTIASPYWRSVSSPQSGSTTPMSMSIYCSRWVNMSSELERRQCRGGGGAGYLVYGWDLLILFQSFRRCEEVLEEEGQEEKK